MQRILLLLFIFVTATMTAQKYHGQKVIGYIPMYKESNLVNYEALTHAVFAFLKTDNDGNILPYEPWEQESFDYFIERTDNPDIIRMISIGGAGVSLTSMTQDDETISHFADTLIAFCQHHGFEAVDLDWEGFQDEASTDGYARLVDTLSNRLSAENMELSIAVAPTSFYGSAVPQSALEQADWVNVMVYDMAGTWESSPFDNHSSFDHMVQAKEYWNSRNVPTGKMVIGIPFYGRQFENTKGGLTTPRLYNEIVAKYPNLNDTINLTDDLTYFNGPKLIRDKVEYLIDSSFNGLLMWEMTQDAVGPKSLLNQIVCAYEGTTCSTEPECPSVDITSDLVAEFNFDGGSSAETSNKSPEVDLTGQETTYDRFGNTNSALYFTYDSLLAVDAHPDYEVDDHTFSFWVYLRQDTATIQNFMDRWNSGSDGTFFVYAWDERLSVQYQTGTIDEGVYTYYNSPVQMQKRTWYHIAVSNGPTTGTKMYLNGSKIFEDTTKFTFLKRPDISLFFGGYGFNGKLDDIKIYSRILSDCDVYELFSSEYANEKVSVSTDITEAGCDTYSLGDEVIRESGEYSVTIDRGADVDSVVNIDITIYEKPFSLSGFLQEGNDLVAWDTDYDIQWYNCDGDEKIEGETGDILSIEQEGEYSIEYFNDYCSFKSSCKPVLVASNSLLNNNTKYNVYPNPTSDNISVSGEDIIKVELYNSLGETILSSASQNIKLGDVSSGIYFIKITNQHGEEYTERIKIN